VTSMGNAAVNIVHVVRQFHPALGGIESVVRELATAQVAAGHRVRVVTLNRVFKATQDQVLPARGIIDGAEVIRLPFFGSTRYPLAPSVIKFVKDADVVHVHAIDFFFDYLAWTKFLHRRKLVISTHGGFFHTPYAARLKRMYFLTITRFSLAMYDLVAAVSVADRELFGRIRRRDIVCIENGVNLSKFLNASSAAPVKAILALGRLSSNKRLDRLLSFLAALRRRDSQWRLTIAGRLWNVEVDDLMMLAKTHQIRDAVEIIVGPDDDKVRELMGCCSVMASASEYEGFGVAAVEAMSAGLFPLVSDIPAFRRLVTRVGTGMLVDFSDVEAAADKFIGKWRDIESDYLRYRRQSIDAASEFDWRQVSQEYVELYEYFCGTKTRNILGVAISVGTAAETARLLDARFEHNSSTIVAFANSHLLNVASRDEDFRAILGNSIVLNDGVGTDIASRILFGSAFPENLNGTDFIPHYLQNTRHRFRVFLLGGRPGVAERVMRHFSGRYPQHQIVGCHHGYLEREGAAEVNAMIQASRADVVLVAMGNPLQERWLAENLRSTGARLGFAVGALFDFASGNAHRAPAWMRSARIEWLYRLIQEPRRLCGRYLVGNPLFVLRVFGQRVSGARRDTVVVTPQ
jgi:alpha-1,3-mannosyltransferase